MGEKRNGSKEGRKPKKVVEKVNASQPSLKGGVVAAGKSAKPGK